MAHLWGKPTTVIQSPLTSTIIKFSKLAGFFRFEFQAANGHWMSFHNYFASNEGFSSRLGGFVCFLWATRIICLTWCEKGLFSLKNPACTNLPLSFPMPTILRPFIINFLDASPLCRRGRGGGEAFFTSGRERGRRGGENSFCRRIQYGSHAHRQHKNENL